MPSRDDAAHERAWQANHAAVGVAKDAVTAARDEQVKQSLAFFACKADNHLSHTEDDCPHAARALKARAEVERRKQLVEDAIATFKAGVTAEQLAEAKKAG